MRSKYMFVEFGIHLDSQGRRKEEKKEGRKDETEGGRVGAKALTKA